MGGTKKVNIKKMLVAALIVTLIAALAAGCSSEDKKAKSEVKRYDTITTAFLELRNSGIDAVVADSGVALAYLQNNPEAKLKTFTDDSFEKEYYGIAMRHEDTELHELVNEGLRRIRENGVYDKIYEKYFGEAGNNYVVPESDNRLNVTYKVASNMYFAPFESVDQDGQPVGFDIDLIRAIAAEMGFAVELMNTDWNGIIASLTSGASDMIISAMTITEERKEEVTFSEPYFEATQYVVVREDSEISTLDDLIGKTVGVQINTTGDFAITDFFASKEN